MNPITYRCLTVDECERIKEIDASQYIANAWREKDGVRQLVSINYYDPGFPNGYDHHLAALKETLETGGCAIGAFYHDQLAGFAGVNREMFGLRYKYVLLDQLFISNEHRRKGIGRRLLDLSAAEAKKWGADKLYICAGSAEETVAFYMAVGCREAEEINQSLYDNDPRDYQLEFEL